MAGIDFNNNRGANLGDPRFSQDAVNLRTLRQYSSILTANTISTVVSGITSGSNISITGNSSAITISVNPNIVTNSVDANTILSGGTDLYSIFLTTADGNDITRVQPGLNIYTGGTPNNPSINISAATLDYLSTTTISANTYYSGSTPLSQIFLLSGTPTGFSGWTASTGMNSIVANNETGNLASGIFSVVGGFNNLSTGNYSFIGNGFTNTATTAYSIVVGGKQNLSSGLYSSILNGFQNTTFGNSSAIIAGSGNTIQGENSVVVGGTNISGVSNDTVYVPFLNIQSTSTDSSLDNILVKSSTGEIKIKSLSAVTSAIITTGITTGLLSGGSITINSDNTKINISEGSAIITDFWTTPGTQIEYRVSWATQSAITLSYLSSNTQSYIGIDKNGIIQQYSSTPTNDIRREIILLAQLGHASKTAVQSVNSYVSGYDNPLSTARDIIQEFRLINSGNIISPNGTNLQINKSNGYLFGLGINYNNNHKNPNKIELSGKTAALFRYRTMTGGTTTPVNTIDPTVYDNNGVITSIGGSSNQATNQRIYLFPNGNIVIQYGQTVYSTLANAISNSQHENFTEFTNLSDSACLIGILSITKGCVDLSNVNDARFLRVSKIGESIGSSAGISISTLQNVYNNSSEPEILTDSIRGALTLKNGSGSDLNNVLEIQNSGGTITSFVSASGNSYFNVLTAQTYYSGSTPLETILNTIISGSTPSSILAYNGLSISGSSDIVLGGNLIAQTTIGASSANQLEITDSWGTMLKSRDTNGNFLLGAIGTPSISASTLIFSYLSDTGTSWSNSNIAFHFGGACDYLNATDTYNFGDYTQLTDTSVTFNMGRSNTYNNTGSITVVGNSNTISGSSTIKVFGDSNTINNKNNKVIIGNYDNNLILDGNTGYINSLPTIYNSGLTGNFIGITSTGDFFNTNISTTGFSSTDTYVTGFTNSDNTFTISNNTGGTLSTVLNTVTGLTVNGLLQTTNEYVTGSLYTNTIVPYASGIVNIGSTPYGTNIIGPSTFNSLTGSTLNATGITTALITLTGLTDAKIYKYTYNESYAANQLSDLRVDGNVLFYDKLQVGTPPFWSFFRLPSYNTFGVKGGISVIPNASNGANTISFHEANGGSGTNAIISELSVDSVTGKLIYNNTISATTLTASLMNNTRIVKRVVSVASSATPALNTNNGDIFSITGLSSNVTSFTTNLTGAPVHGDLISIELTDNGVARTLTFGASFSASGTLSLPTTTVISTLLRCLFQWNSATSKWQIVAVV